MIIVLVLGFAFWMASPDPRVDRRERPDSLASPSEATSPDPRVDQQQDTADDFVGEGVNHRQDAAGEAVGEAANGYTRPSVVIPEPRWLPNPQPVGGMTYLDLRHSKNRTTMRRAERYFNLIKRQEWRSESGKRVMAKYVAHTPDLKWVKLEIAVGTGKDRVVKEAKVEVRKLNLTCQSRVKQIATVQAKLEELLATEQDKQSWSRF
jgi:hypothetical protein